MSIRILVVAQYRLIGYAIAALLKLRNDLRVVGVMVNADEITESAGSKRSKPPDVFLIDGDLLTQEKELVQQLARVSPGIPLIVLASERTATGLTGVLRSGGASVVLKDAKPAELYLAIKTVAQGGTYLSRAVAEHAAGFFAGDRPLAQEVWTLTPRQRQILQLLAEGFTTKEIADQLSLSPRTIESHRSHIMERLGIRHLAGLVQYAIRTGMITP
jgi:DNA-binding NarL/FixJ family response regulator